MLDEVRFENAEMSAKCYKRLKNCLTEALGVKVNKKYVSKLMYQLFKDTPAEIRISDSKVFPFSVHCASSATPIFLSIFDSGKNTKIYKGNSISGVYMSAYWLSYVGFFRKAEDNGTLWYDTEQIYMCTNNYTVKIHSLIQRRFWWFDSVWRAFYGLKKLLSDSCCYGTPPANIIKLYNIINLYLACNQYRGILIEIKYNGQVIKMLDEILI